MKHYPQEPEEGPHGRGHEPSRRVAHELGPVSRWCRPRVSTSHHPAASTLRTHWASAP